MCITYRLLAIATTQVGMHHAAVNRPGPNDRDLNHQIVKALWPKPGQHCHLRSAFDLEHPHRIPTADIAINSGVFGGDARECLNGIERLRGGPLLTILMQHLQSFTDRSQHPQPQDIDFKEAESVDVILIEWDYRASWHARGLNWSHAFERLS